MRAESVAAEMWHIFGVEQNFIFSIPHLKPLYGTRIPHRRDGYMTLIHFTNKDGR